MDKKVLAILGSLVMERRDLRIFIKLLFISVFICLLTGLGQYSNAEANTRSQVIDTNLSLVQPFNLFYNHYDLHVMLYFNGHPEYEAIEAMIKLKNVKKPEIQAIMTRHDQTQVDYLNDYQQFKMRQTAVSGREIYYTPIEFAKSDRSVLLKFSTHKGENVVFNLHIVGKATTTYSGLIDPEGHAKESTLPVMWSGLNSLASTESSIDIDGTTYQIPVKFKIPFFFIGLKGYYSEGFSIGVINAGKTRIEMVKTPGKIEAGQEWLIKKGSLKSVYLISEFDGCGFTVRNKNNLERINGMVLNNRIMIRSIETSASPESQEKMVIRFSPALPESSRMLDGEREVVNIQIDINEHEKVIQGKMEMKKEEGQVIIKLIPAKPKWAIKRVFQVEISMENNNIFQIQSSIIN